MLDWLNTPTESESATPREPGQDSGEVRGSPVFPVSRFRDGFPGNAKQPANPHGYAVFPVSRFSRFQNEGGPEKDMESGGACEEKARDISEPLPDLLNAMAAVLDPAEVDELRSMAAGNPEQAAEVCRLILAAPPFPTAEDAAELDRLILRLCDLEPWLAGYLPEMQAARQAMAPARYALELARFRQWVREAEAKHGAAPVGAGHGSLSAP
jgi:hypothetical protein